MAKIIVNCIKVIYDCFDTSHCCGAIQVTVECWSGIPVKPKDPFPAILYNLRLL